MNTLSAETVQYVVFPDEHTGKWIAQGLELDICVQANSLEELPAAFEQAVHATANANVLDGKDPFDGIDRAPYKYWEMSRVSPQHPPLFRHRKRLAVSRNAASRVVNLVEHLVAFSYAISK